MGSVFQLLNPDNTIAVNRPLAHALGLSEAVVYAALLAKREWYSEHDMLADGWFYSTAADLEESTTLSKCQQSRCLKKLISAGLILCENRGIPAKRYFYIVDDIQILESIIHTSDSISQSPSAGVETEQQQVRKPDNKKSDFLTTCSEETSHKTRVNKTRENKPELINLDSARGQIGFDELSQKYGADFAELAAGVTAEGISGSFTLTTDGRTIPADKISSAFKQADFRTVCHVADYIAGKDGIRDLRAYLRKALYTAVQEMAQRPKPSGTDRTEKQLEEARRAAYAEDIMDEIRAQYADLAEKPDSKAPASPAGGKFPERNPYYREDIMDEIRAQYADLAEKPDGKAHIAGKVAESAYHNDILSGVIRPGYCRGAVPLTFTQLWNNSFLSTSL